MDDSRHRLLQRRRLEMNWPLHRMPWNRISVIDGGEWWEWASGALMVVGCLAAVVWAIVTGGRGHGQPPGDA